MNNKQEIDAVIMWVDDQDPAWQINKKKYAELENRPTDSGPNRYRDWGTLKYLFRGLEIYAPWIRKIFFVTSGQVPLWLNINHPKLVLVNHEDYIPNEYLPTFNSPVIDLNLWRIKELSEFFILFNDDMFLMHKVNDHDFVVNGMCCNMFSERPVMPGKNMIFEYRRLLMMQVLSKYYSRKSVLKKHWRKILSPKYGLMSVYNFLWMLMPFSNFSSLALSHVPLALKKSTCRKVYLRDKALFDNTGKNKFRTLNDMCRFIYSFEDLLSGDFYPKNMSQFGIKLDLTNDSSIDAACAEILHGKHKTICINDEYTDDNFENMKIKLLECFEYKFPQKSKFEL